MFLCLTYIQCIQYNEISKYHNTGMRSSPYIGVSLWLQTLCLDFMLYTLIYIVCLRCSLAQKMP